MPMVDLETRARSMTSEERALIYCVTCGMPWELHTPECSRHEYRPAWVAEARRAMEAARRAAHAAAEVSGLADAGPRA